MATNVLPRAARPATTTSPRILVVEDNAVCQSVASNQLELLDCRVDTVESCPQALAALDRQTYDVILMDCQLPGIDGFETTRRIRGRSDGRRVPIIAVTANGGRERCLEVGMNDYLRKPFRFRELAAAIDRWLPVEAEKAAEADGEADAAPVSTEILDPKVIERVRRLGRLRGRDVLAKVAGIFLDQAPPRLRQLRSAAAAGDAETVVEAAHFVKGSARSLGAVGLCELLQAIEDRGQDGELGDWEGELTAVERAFERTAGELRAIVAAGP